MVFLREGFEDFQEFAFELKTIATMSLSPSRIGEYLEIIFKQQGLEACQAVLEYVVVVLAKYLQMVVAYDIHRQKIDRVEAQFDEFNTNYNQLVNIFAQITGEQFKPGTRPAPKKRVAAVRPVPRDEAGGVLPPVVHQVEDRSAQELRGFLGRCGLGHLVLEEGLTLEELLNMDQEDMKTVGIKTHKDRKKLQQAIPRER